MSEKIIEPNPEYAPIKNIYEHGKEDYTNEPQTSLIVVKQLPIIEEHLKTIKQATEAKVADALALVCTEETLVAVKEARAALNKDFKVLEDTRKMVKNAVLAPYNEFEASYKECVTNVFTSADAKLKARIDEVETELKETKKAEIAAYFNEYRESKGIDFVTFENANINVIRSASDKKLKEQAKAFIDRICEDLSLIETQEHKTEILVEYKKSLNVSNAITTVVERYKAIERAKEIEAHIKAQKEAEQAAVEKVEAVVEAETEALTPPTVEEPTATPAKRYSVTFMAVADDLDKIRRLKAFMEKEGIEYEQL